MMQGIETALRVQRAAGAREIYGPHNDSVTFRGGNERDFERFLAHVRGLGVRPNHIGMFCAHQMSSCRIGGSAAQGALSPEGESYEVRNLFVADASALPTSTGVNPMITIMSTAHHIAQHVKQRLASHAVCV
jgi:choline dehydrogenase-like flavoprotein